MGEVRRVGRRAPRTPPEKSPAPARKPRRSPRTLQCSCGATEVVPNRDRLVVRGKGFRKEYQWIRCALCAWEYRFAPNIVWEGKISGRHYENRGDKDGG